MDTMWERSNPIFQIDKQAVEQIVREFDSRCVVEGFTPITIGCRNSNFAVKTSHGKYLLRICPAGDRAFLKERTLYENLHAAVRMPAVYFVSEKNSTGSVCMLYEFVEGLSLQTVILRQGSAPDAAVAKAAEAAAGIHNVDRPLSPELNGLDLPPYDSWYGLFIDNPHTAARLGPGVCQRLKSMLKGLDALLPEIDSLKALTHGDYRPANMLVDEAGELVVVDWEFAGCGHTLADIGQFFRYSSCFTDHHRRLFQETYDSHANKKLPEDWYRLSRLRDLVNPLQMLGTSADKPYLVGDLTAVVLDILTELGY